MKYIIEFEGSCEIEASTEAEAGQKFCEYIDTNKALPHNLYHINFILED